MNVEVNWVAVILATLSSMVIGTFWYTPKVFGTMWMKLVGMDPKKAKGLGTAVGPIIITLIVSFLTAFILAHMIFLAHAFFNNSRLYDALTTAFWLWLGLVAARFITHDVFEGRPAVLTLINISHELATLLVMGGIIGLFK